ncbi:MAG: type III pantothenate kinase [Candidatus Eremiobacteraeota bacterium]|nr:type III pantothenate kinase [Candidatus Eremiobacteraeota bacterium]MBC5827566.1 type III pantothenate kinase [Candidatus Eremiobacteraeota bacterium]
MLLAIEIGNTNLKFGLYEVAGVAAGTLVHTWRSMTKREQTGDELAALVDSMLRLNGVSRSAVDRVVVANVVPPLYRAITGMARRYIGCRPEFLSAARQSLMPVRTTHPAELGADLIAGAIGGVAKYGSPLIVVGFGTATTFAAIGSEGEYLGTAIAPGIAISVDALVRHAAKLMSVPLVRPPRSIGADTSGALQSGILLGAVGQTEYLVAKMAAEMGGRPTVVATGGLAELVAPHTRSIDAVDERLVLDGLYRWATSESQTATADPA